jgi:hypothetical protein
MSHVDNWILILSVSEGQRQVMQLNNLLKKVDSEREQCFRKIDDSNWGGTKFPEIDAYAMACNHFPVPSVLDCLSMVEWNDAEDSRIICNTQSGRWVVASLDDLPLK